MSTFKAQESKNLAQLANIRGKIHGLTGLNLVQPSRRFIYEGDVDKVSATSGIINTRHLFLFNDLLIYGSVKHKGSEYEYSDHIFIKDLSLKDISFKSHEVHNTKSTEEVEKHEESNSPSSKPRIKRPTRESSEGIMKAVLGGNIEHLRDGFDISVHDSETGQTILHKISHIGHSTLLHLLLESYSGNTSALVNAKDFHGATALHYAANSGRADCSKILVSYGANPELVDDSQATPLHYAARSGYIDVLTCLLELKISLVSKRDSQGLTPAGYAAFHGHKAVLSSLLHNMRSSFSQANRSGSSLALSRRSISFLTHDQYTLLTEPVHFAAMNGYIECVEEVLNVIDAIEADSTSKVGANVKDQRGLTAAHHAAVNGHLATLSMLHKRGADMQSRDNTGGTVFHAVCTGGSVECLKYLLANAVSKKTDFACKDSGGLSPLHRSVVAGHLCLVWEILNSSISDSDLVNMKDARGQTALHIASENKWGGCALLLINIGKADPTVRDEDGFTPLHVAIKNGSKEVVSYIANTEHELTRNEAQLLIELGKHHPDCTNIIAGVTGLRLENIGISHPPISERTSSKSSISDISYGSEDESSEGSDVDTLDDDDDNPARIEIRQRVAEIWRGVSDNQLLSTLFLETVRNLYRLPQDGDFGVTYWTYVNNFTQKVSLNPATDRGLMALRRDLNLDFLENHSRIGMTSSTSSIDVRGSVSLDEVDKSGEKPLLQRTVATRRIPLSSSPAIPARPPLMNRTPSSTISPPPLPVAASSPALLSGIKQNSRSATTSSATSATSPTLRSFVVAPIVTDLPYSSVSAPSSPNLTSPTPGWVPSSRRSNLLSPSLSLGSFSTLLADQANFMPPTSPSTPTKENIPVIPDIKELEELDVFSLKLKTPTAETDTTDPSESEEQPRRRKSSLESERRRHKKGNSSTEELVRKPELDKEALLRMLSAKVKGTTSPDAADIARALDGGFDHRDSKRLSAGKKSNSEPKLLSAEDEITKKLAQLKNKIDREKNSKEPDQHVATPRGDESNKGSHLAIRDTAGTVARASRDKGSSERKPSSKTTKSQVKLDKGHSQPKVDLQHSKSEPKVEPIRDDSRKTKRKSDSSFWENAITVSPNSSDAIQSPDKSTQAAEKKEVFSLDNISAAIESLIEKDEIPQSHPPIARTTSTWRTTKRLVMLDKKREEQIIALLHGHDVVPKRLKQAIEDADCTVLNPGLLSALLPILPTKKEATICLEHQLPETEGLKDLSDRELSQVFVAEMASIPRVHQRVESLVARSDFEMKASVIKHMIKAHFAICSELTTNYRLKEVIDILISHSTKLSNGSKKESISSILSEAIDELREKIPEFLDIIKKITSTNITKDSSDIGVAWNDLQYGLSTCKQEIQKCLHMDFDTVEEFIKEAEPEIEELRDEVDVWETITSKIGSNLSNLLVYLDKQPTDDLATGDLISCLCGVFSLIINASQEEVVQSVTAEDPSNPKRHKHRKHKHRNHNGEHKNSKSPFGRENLRGEKILQPELTPLRVTFNAYKDFCAKTSYLQYNI